MCAGKVYRTSWPAATAAAGLTVSGRPEINAAVVWPRRVRSDAVEAEREERAVVVGGGQRRAVLAVPAHGQVAAVLSAVLAASGPAGVNGPAASAPAGPRSVRVQAGRGRGAGAGTPTETGRRRVDGRAPKIAGLGTLNKPFRVRTSRRNVVRSLLRLKNSASNGKISTHIHIFIKLYVLYIII